MAAGEVIEERSDHVVNEVDEKIAAPLEIIKRDVQMLSDQNKIARRRALERITKETVQKSPSYESEVLQGVFYYLHKPVLKLCNDPIDRTRELAINLISEFCSQMSQPDEYLSYIVPTIHQRLTSEKNSEPTEEIRLLLVESILKLMKVCHDKIGIYIDELIQILQKTIVDPFPDVRKVSCTCISELATLSPERFYQQGESLVTPLIKSLSHQHNKVRAAVLKTIGIVVLATSGKAIDEVFTHIAQRTFDHSGPVRLMVAEVAGKWILELRDRYSYFHKLLPLLLTGFSDELPEVKQKSEDYFAKAGQQYETENEDEFKKKKLYPIEHKYEEKLGNKRACIGCRTLVQRNFSKILPAIIHDITDWNAATRLKSSSLLHTLVFHCEDQITMHMELLSQGLYQAAKDEEKHVVTQVLQTAGLVGLFVEPAVWCRLILPQVENAAHSNPLSLYSSLAILAEYIENAHHELLAIEIQKICETLNQPDVCTSRDEKCQQSLLRCIRVTINQTGIDHTLVASVLFSILLRLFALTSSVDVQTEVQELLDRLSEVLNLSNRYSLFTNFGLEILSNLQSSAELWTSQSPECFLFVALLSESGPSISTLLPTAVPIFIQCSDISKDPEMRTKFFTMMSELVISLTTNAKVIESFHEYTVDIIKKSILPNCVWQAGRTASAVRSVAISFLWALLESRIITGDHLKECYSELQTQVVSSLEDFNETTRLVTMKVLLKLLKVCKTSMHVEQLHAIYPEFLKRMDDSVDEIRIVTCKAFTAYFRKKVLHKMLTSKIRRSLGKRVLHKTLTSKISALPSDYDVQFFKAHIEFIFKSLLIHLDDPNENIQKAVLTCLKDGCSIHPGVLKTEIEDIIRKHRSKRYCEELLQLCDERLKTTS